MLFLNGKQLSHGLKYGRAIHSNSTQTINGETSMTT